MLVAFKCVCLHVIHAVPYENHQEIITFATATRNTPPNHRACLPDSDMRQHACKRASAMTARKQGSATFVIALLLALGFSNTVSRDIFMFQCIMGPETLSGFCALL